jgi:hypothetical protein
MAETNSTEPVYVFHDGFHSAGPLVLKFLRFATTFIIAITIIGSWPRFDLIAKFLAVVLLVNVLFVPTLIRMREKRSGKKVENSIFEQNGYIQLMMMAMLMARAFLHNH